MSVVTKTRTELVSRAATKLGLIGSGQSLESEDSDTIDAAVDSVLADLSSRSIVSIANDDEIDVDVFEWVADVLGDLVAPDFGKPRDPGKVANAEKMLRTISSGGPTYEPLAIDYF